MELTGEQKAFQETGTFWVHGSSFSSAGGTFLYDIGKGLRLILAGRIVDSETDETSVIHGTVSGSKCSIFRNQFHGGKPGRHGVSEIKVQAELAVIGSHLSSYQDPAIKKLYFSFDSFNEWVQFEAFWDRDRRFDFETISIKSPDPFEVRLDYLGATLFLHQRTSRTLTSTRAELTSDLGFKLEFDQKVSLESSLNAADELSSLFALLTWRSSRFSRVTGLHSTQDQEPDSPLAFYRDLWASQTSRGHWGVCITRLDDLRPHLGTIIRNWFNPSIPTQTIRRLFVSVLKSEDVNFDYQFLTLIQIAEGYDREMRPGGFMDPSQYEAVRNKLTASIPKELDSDHRTSLKSRIMFGNELSLRRRLKRIEEQLPENLRKECFPNWKSRLGKMVDARNYLTHRDSQAEEAKFDQRETAKACRTLKLLLTINILSDLGVPVETLSMISKRRYWKVISRN